MAQPDPTEVAPSGASVGGFEVHLSNFSGPFDLLLGLISRHRLDITEVALAQVTDEFIAFIRTAELSEADGGPGWDLSQVSEFLVVAATLLDLKAARLLPQGDVEDAEDIELLEARDLLFARLLQYRAYKLVAADLAERYASAGRRYGRQVTLEPHLAAMLPELVWTIGPEELARIAAQASQPKVAPQVDIAHLHSARVSVREQAALVVSRLRSHGALSFRALVADAGATDVVVGRFLALLELFREGVIAFEQMDPLGDLTVRWTGQDDTTDVQVAGDFDEEDQ